MNTDLTRRGPGLGCGGVLRWSLLVLVLAAAAFGASPSELGARARERFEVLPLREGVLLKPVHAANYAVIEITAQGVAIDGEELSGRALRRRLGEDADLVEDIADLEPAALRGVALGSDAARPGAASQVPLPAPPAPPGASGVPAVPTVPGAPAPPEAPSGPTAPRSPRRHADAKVSVASSAHVARGETSDDVFVLGGAVHVEGEVRGDAVAVGGSVFIDGRVTGDVVAVGGGVELGPNADVGGEVTSVGGHIQRDPAARVGGRTSEVAMGPLFSLGRLGRLGRHAQVDFEPFEHVASLLSAAFRLILFGLFGCLAILLVREPLERVADKVGDEVWRCGLTGLVAPFVLLPLFVITAVVLAVSVIGIPLLVLLPFAFLALVVGGFLGYSAVALWIGRWMERRFGWNLGSPYLALFIGLLCIQGWTLLGRALDWGVSPLGFVSGLLLFAGFVVRIVVCFIGFGAVLITRFGTYAVWRGWRWHRPETMPAWSGDLRAPASPAPPASEPPSPAPAAESPAPESGGDTDGETKPGT